MDTLDLTAKKIDKALDVTSSADFAAKIPDIKTFGDPDTWTLLCKASSKEGGWMKSTKAMGVPGIGVIVQVSTQQGDRVAEALATVEDAYLHQNEDGLFRLKLSEDPENAGRKLLSSGEWV